MARTGVWALTLVGLVAAVCAAGQGDLQKMPVKEVTVFKDGHALLLHEGEMPTDGEGNVVLDYLPRPVIGTFWAYENEDKAALASVHAGTKSTKSPRTPTSFGELLGLAKGKRVRLTLRTSSEARLDAVGFPAMTRHAGIQGQVVDVAGDVVLLKADGATHAVAVADVLNVAVLEEATLETSVETSRNVMTLRLDWEGKARDKARVGMMYVERGIRWIPNYRVHIDGDTARVELQATLVNELYDLQNVTAHLVVGVPRFAFKDTVDPISLQKTVAQVAAVAPGGSQTAYGFSNAIMSQRVMPVQQRARAGRGGTPAGMDLGADIASRGKSEDLYIFELENITLAKGERLVVPVAEFELPYEDVYKVDLPFGPPPEVRYRFNTQQQAQMARLFHAPKAEHVLRLTNTSDAPLTTAPALIMRDGRVLAQGMMTYTAVGSRSDLEMTTAVDISVTRSDTETGRQPDAYRWRDHTFDRVDLKGEIHLANHRDGPVNLEVTRFVLGHVDSAGHHGKTSQLGWHEGEWMVTGEFPYWWHWHSWPWWWYGVNAIGKIRWDVELEPGAEVDLNYAWHYYWD